MIQTGSLGSNSCKFWGKSLKTNMNSFHIASDNKESSDETVTSDGHVRVEWGKRPTLGKMCYNLQQRYRKKQLPHCMYARSDTLAKIL